jgi:hypothetical protein
MPFKKITTKPIISRLYPKIPTINAPIKGINNILDLKWCTAANIRQTHCGLAHYRFIYAPR